MSALFFFFLEVGWGGERFVFFFLEVGWGGERFVFFFRGRVGR